MLYIIFAGRITNISLLPIVDQINFTVVELGVTTSGLQDSVSYFVNCLVYLLTLYPRPTTPTLSPWSREVQSKSLSTRITNYFPNPQSFSELPTLLDGVISISLRITRSAGTMRCVPLPPSPRLASDTLTHLGSLQVDSYMTTNTNYTTDDYYRLFVVPGMTVSTYLVKSIVLLYLTFTIYACSTALEVSGPMFSASLTPIFLLLSHSLPIPSIILFGRLLIGMGFFKFNFN